MRLGEAGVAGSDEYHFKSPSAVAVAANGDIFVADGHGADENNRVVKYSKDGKFIKAWGKTGYGPGEFRTLHGLAIDSRGRVFVADRSNNRIQLFDQEGKYLSTWTQFGTPSGIAFDEQDQIYVADSESDNVNNPGWEQGIRIGDARTGWVKYFILDQGGNPNTETGSGPEFVAVGSPRQRVRRGAPSTRPAEIRQGEMSAVTDRNGARRRLRNRRASVHLTMNQRPRSVSSREVRAVAAIVVDHKEPGAAAIRERQADVRRNGRRLAVGPNEPLQARQARERVADR